MIRHVNIIIKGGNKKILGVKKTFYVKIDI